MYYEDLSPCGYFEAPPEARLLAVGWLEHPTAFRTGKAPAGLVARFREVRDEANPLRARNRSGHFVYREQSVSMPNHWSLHACFMGHHLCSICEAAGAGERAVLHESSSNLFIPGDGVIYATPAAMDHYVEEHSYVPPEEFVRALFDCPDPSTRAYIDAIRATYRPARPSGPLHRQVADYVTFPSIHEYFARRRDVEFWLPYVKRVFERHDLWPVCQAPVAGFNATHPTFVCGNLVMKLFGHFRAWREAYAAESAAHALVATDPEIAAPRVLGEGSLFDGEQAPWPYLVTPTVAGVSWRDAELSHEQRLSLAAELGEQVRRVHALRPSSAVLALEDWPAPDVAAAAERSSLPPHLAAQAEDYVARLGPFDPVFVHADLCANHCFVEDGRLSGIIDWGDAMVADRHCELIQIYRDTFECDKALFKVFLDACDWPVGKDFPRKTLGLALHRQAIGLAQHYGMDVFEPIAALLPLKDIATLDDLATELFAV